MVVHRNLFRKQMLELSLSLSLSTCFTQNVQHITQARDKTELKITPCHFRAAVDAIYVLNGRDTTIQTKAAVKDT